VLGYFGNEEVNACCKVNLYMKEEQIPSQVAFSGVATVPGRILFAQTNVTVDLLVSQVRAFDLVLHRQRFTAERNRFMSVFAVDNQVDCTCGTIRNKELQHHVSSSQDLHGNFLDFVSVSFLMYKTCVQVYSACATMMCRVAQSQLPTNLCRINMHPSIWRIITASLQNEFGSDNHPFYIDQIPSIITVYNVNFVNNVMALQTRLEMESPQHHYTDHAKFYTCEMIHFLQTHCFGSMFVVGARLPIPSPPSIGDDEFVNYRSMIHGMVVNIIMHILLVAQYGPPTDTFRRAGIDGLTLLYERHSTQLVVKLHYESPYVEDAVRYGLLPLSYSNFPMPLIGFLFNLDVEPREVLHYSGGATVEVATNGDIRTISTMHIGQIFTIMSDELMAQRVSEKDAMVVAAAAAIALG
jgi:hypothetical protein